MGTTDFASVFDNLCYSATDEPDAQDKGTRFVRLVKRYVEREPKYAVTKMRYGRKSGAWDKTRMMDNGHITLDGIGRANRSQAKRCGSVYRNTR